MKINKTYPPFYGGISEQDDILILDNQVKDSINFIPSLVDGMTKRQGLVDVANLDGTLYANNCFHHYVRGINNDTYMFTLVSAFNVRVYKITRATGAVTTVATITNGYFGSDASKLKALTVQDTTFIINTSFTVGQDVKAMGSQLYEYVAYYWLKRSSNDETNPYTYACYINGSTFSASNKDSTAAATTIANAINAHFGSSINAEAKGSVIKIKAINYSINSFSTWDSWGNQASKGWMGNVRRITDLPDMMPAFSDGTVPYVRIGQASESGGITYYVKWNGSSWEECVDPLDTRGLININTPYKVGISEAGVLTVSEQLQLYAPKVGDTTTNPNPSFVGHSLQDILFFKNRLGFVSNDNVILSETGNYDNFYATSVLDILETDTIDVAIAGNTASKIYYAIPFQRGLYLFTADSQFELIGDGGNFSPTTVSIVPVSSYSMDVNVRPVASGTSLYFIANSGTTNQLREFVINNDTLVASGIDLTLSVPNLLPAIDMISVSSVNNLVVLNGKSGNTLYVYKFSEDGKERIQSAWTKFSFSPIKDILYHYIDDDNLYIVSTNLTSTKSVLSKMGVSTTKITTTNAYKDVYLSTLNTIEASLKLPRWIPKVGSIKNIANKLLVKTVTGSSEGDPYIEIYHNKYKTTSTQTYGTSGRLKDKKASILAPSTDIEITIKHTDNTYCTVNSLVFEGLYKISSREMA